MKKLLSIALCAAATMAFAEDVSVAVANVGVTKITIPANQKNTIIASSFDALGTTSGVTIDKLIRSATGLAADDQLMIFTEGTYYSFKWNATDQKWEASTAITSAGASAEAKDVTTATTVGQGIWFIRNDASSSDEVSLVLYGATPSSTDVTTTAGAWNLIGNPTASTYEITAGAEGDRIITVTDGSLREWTYDTTTSKWGYDTMTTETVGSMKIAKKTRKEANPSLAAGIGFWYYTPNKTTITWTTAQ